MRRAWIIVIAAAGVSLGTAANPFSTLPQEKVLIRWRVLPERPIGFKSSMKHLGDSSAGVPSIEASSLIALAQDLLAIEGKDGGKLQSAQKLQESMGKLFGAFTPPKDYEMTSILKS